MLKENTSLKVNTDSVPKLIKEYAMKKYLLQILGDGNGRRAINSDDCEFHFHSVSKK